MSGPEVREWDIEPEDQLVAEAVEGQSEQGSGQGNGLLERGKLPALDRLGEESFEALLVTERDLLKPVMVAAFPQPEGEVLVEHAGEAGVLDERFE